MKNLFKNLMLVAVAAMAFTACEEKQTETNVDNKGEGTTYTIEVSLDDTRSAFGELDGNSFPSYWEGNEDVEVYLVNWDSYYYDGDENATLIVDSDNKKTAKITFTLPQAWDYYNSAYVDAPSSGEFYVASPSDVVDIDSYNRSVNWNKLKNQTPRENNVDANAHVVIAEYEGDIYSGMNLSFKHAVAYAKMSFTALPEGVENINSVVVELDGMTYTLNTEYTENIWFAVQESTPATASVTIVSGEKNYKKELVLNNNLSFTTGAVTGFKVDMSTAEEVVVEEGGSVFEADYEITSITPAGLSLSYGYKWNFVTNGGHDYEFMITTTYDQGNKFVEGEYTFAKNGAYAGTKEYNFGVRLYSPYTFNDGTMEVFVNGDEYTVNLTIDDGETLKYQYVGTIENNYN